MRSRLRASDEETMVMAAASGPKCEGGCGKRVSVRRVTRCPWCRRVLCLKCFCPAKCYVRLGSRRLDLAK